MLRIKYSKKTPPCTEWDSFPFLLHNCTTLFKNFRFVINEKPCVFLSDFKKIYILVDQEKIKVFVPKQNIHISFEQNNVNN